MKTLLTSRCVNQRGAGQQKNINGRLYALVVLFYFLSLLRFRRQVWM
jgi:hypothetical protein